MKAAADRVEARMAAAEERVEELERSLTALVQHPQPQAQQQWSPQRHR